MKKLTLFLLLLQCFFTFAQAPQKMAYQSVVRNANNQIVANQNIGVKISIVEGSITGTIVYAETHTTTTNANGLFTLEAGGGTPTTGTFAAINWGNGSHYIKSEIDVTGGTNYTLSGTMELLSVPYALYAAKSGNASLINTVTEPAGANCANGGTKIEVGLDTNNNGILESSEVNNTLTRYVCNGISSATNSTSYGSQVFTSSGTFLVPNGVTSVLVEAYGAGGGGGGGNGGLSYAENYNSFGGGGGASGAFKKIRINVTPNTLINVTIGSGGFGGLAGIHCSGSLTCVGGGNGAAGGSTIFGSFLTVSGGGGGSGGGIWNGGWIPGYGGNALDNGVAGTTGQVFESQNNHNSTEATGGNGAAFPLNGLMGGIGGTINTPAAAGDSFCVGGGGGAARILANCCEAGFSGANGSPGLLIVYW